MPLSKERLSRGRVGFSFELTSAEIEGLIRDEALQILQTHERVDPKTWEILNDRFFRFRPEVQLRVYGFYGDVCDLSFVLKLTNVRRFSADCIRDSINVACIGSMASLESLSVGIYDLDNFDFLKDIGADSLKELSLHATASTKPSLENVGRFHALERVYLEGQKREIEVLAKLACLRELTLRSITVPSLDFLELLPRLSSIDIKLGGTSSLEVLARLKHVKYLELWQVKGLKDLSPISGMTGLQFLFLQSLVNVTQLPDFSRLKSLRRVHLESMKGIHDLSPIEFAPALEEFCHFSAQGMEPKHYAGILRMTTLKSKR